MKTIILLILFSSSLCGADIYTTNTVGDLTTVIRERSAENGLPQRHLETVYRGKKLILRTVSMHDKNGNLVLNSRSYYVDGDCVMIESDDTGDGRGGQVLLKHPGTDDIEMFTRMTNGTIEPASTKDLTTWKEHTAAADKAMAESFQKMRDTNMTDEEIGKLL